MNILQIFVVAIILTSGAQPYIIAATDLETTTEQRKLLSKLQDFPEPRNETKPLKWNEVLADVLVNKVKIFSLKHDNIPAKEEQPGTLTAWFGKVLVIYKQFIYDKFVCTPKERNVINVSELSDVDKENDPAVDEAPNHFQDILVNKKLNSTDPKADVEIIEPKYHGRLSDADEENLDDEDKIIICPQGYVKSDKGCLNVHSRLILAVPSQCPNGYRLDRLGFCRLVFVFDK